MTTTVYFVRHGSHDRVDRVLCGRMAGVGLSDRGVGECEAIGRRLAAEPVDAIYASPLERTRRSAELVAAGLGLSVEPAEDLIEIDFGDWTGAGFAQLEADPRWAAWNAQRSQARPPGGESMAEAQARVGRFVADVARRHPGRGVVAVSHGDVIKAALMAALGLSLDAHQRLEVSPGSLSVLVAGEWGRKVHSINEVPA